MIDLRNQRLPTGIVSEGRVYELDTDFRTWIAFEHDMYWDGIAGDYIFKGEVPLSVDSFEAVMEFYESPNVTPSHSSGGSSDRAIDLVLDGDYIVAAFQQAYGIDLTSIEYMHWHRFKALLSGLPDETLMAKVMGYRGWKKSKDGFEESMAKMKAKWKLPVRKQRGKERLDEWADSLGL